MSKILVSAKERGAGNLLAPVAAELLSRGHDVTIYASGSDSEAVAFANLPHRRGNADDNLCSVLAGCEVLLTGMSHAAGPEGRLLQIAKRQHIPTIAALDQNSNHIERFGLDSDCWPNAFAVPDELSKDTMRKVLGIEASDRCEVVGWAALDCLAVMRQQHTYRVRENTLLQPGLSPNNQYLLFCSQNIPPRPDEADNKQAQRWYQREINVSQQVFEFADNYGISLVVKPHPKEDPSMNNELAKKYSGRVLAPNSVDTRQLMLASHAVVTSLSTCMLEGCALDRNTGAILTDVSDDELQGFPPVLLKAIPYTRTQAGIFGVMDTITSEDKVTNTKLALERARFSVDGKGASRIADLAEQYVR